MALVPEQDTSDERYKLVYDEALRRIEGQERDLDEMRSRAGTVITIGIAITAFLGGFVLDRRSLGATGVTGMVLLAQ